MQQLFEDRFEAYIHQIKSIEDINENAYSEYVDGAKLNNILNKMVGNEAMLKSLMMQQFENSHCYKEYQPLKLQKYDIDFKLDEAKFLLHECKLFFVIIICIKVSFDEMQIKKEKEQKMQQEMEQESKSKGKKSKKDKKKKEVEEIVDIEKESNSEQPQELKLINVLPEHVTRLFDQF